MASRRRLRSSLSKETVSVVVKGEGITQLETMVRQFIKLVKRLHRHCRVVYRKTTPSTLDRLMTCDSEFDEIRTSAWR
jgi:hypothetical protein